MNCVLNAGRSVVQQVVGHLRLQSKARRLLPPALLIILFLSSCGLTEFPQPVTIAPTNEVTVQMTTPVTESKEKLYAAVATGQIIIDGDYMRIGVGNLEADDEFVDANGETRHGNTARLWLFFRDQPGLDQSVPVYEDQMFEMYGHNIRVVSIDLESRQVVLGISVVSAIPEAPSPE